MKPMRGTPRAPELPQITRLPDKPIFEQYFMAARSVWFNRDYPQILIDLGFNRKAAGVMLACAVKESR